MIFVSMVGAGSLAVAADVLVLKNGQSREGEVLGVSDGKVTLKVGPAQSAIPLDQIESAIVAPPDELATAQQTKASGNSARALIEVRPIVEKYAGLPAPWVGHAYALLGDSLLELDQVAEAEKVFKRFTELYPDAGDLSAVSIARLDVAKDDFAAAKEKLEPIIAEASGIKSAESTKSATYGRAFLLMGQVKESEGDLQEALSDYLMTVTVFYADAAAVAEAQERATKLVDEKNVIAP
ncbi:MAG: hypothetical protein WA771_11945 [Chthoniobacterales bacterium]